MKQEKILVIGGTGKTGRKVAKKLNSLGHSVRIGSRNSSPSFDWEKPETWKDPIEGMDKIYITFQPDLAVPGAQKAIKGLIEEASRANIQKLVLLSGRGESEAELCEQLVVDSGIAYTIVRADWFNQNFSEGLFTEAIKVGKVAVPKANVPIPFVDTDDIADVAVTSLLNNTHDGKTYKLTGPDLWTFEDCIATIEKSLNRNIEFTAVSIDEYTEMLKAINIPDDFVWLVNYLFINVLDGRNSNTTDTIEKILGRPAKNFKEFAKEAALAGVWNKL